ncbi:hypothetical protein D3C85_1940440 [compost metagenome]
MITTVNSERKNSVALGFRPLVTNPDMKAPRDERCSTAIRSALAGSAGRARRALMPI